MAFSWFKRQFRGGTNRAAGAAAAAAHGAEHDRQRQAFQPEPELPFAAELTATEADVFNGELIFATSSNVHQWRYDGKNLKLYVQFKGSKGHDGGVYMYPNVSFAKAMDFFRTDSPGRFVHHFLKGTGEQKIGTMPPEPYHNVVTTLDPWDANDRTR